MGFNITSLIATFNRRYFISAGLHPTTVDIDGETTLRCWVPKSLLARSPSTPKANSIKPPLLLIHGFGPEATWQWQFQVRPLSRHFDLIVPDLVFFGGSTTRSADRSEAFQATCVARLVDALGVRGTVSVVGTSYGGFVAYHMARALGEGRVGRVVIASSDLLKGDDDDVALLERAGVENVADLILPRSADNLRILLRLVIHRPLRFLPGFVLHDIIRNLYMANFDEKLELIKGVTLGNKEQFRLDPLPQEVLIMWGEHDNIFPLEKAHQIKKKLGEKARVVVLKNTSHVPQVEDPHRFNQNLYMANFDEMLELIKGVTLGNKEQFWLNPLPREALIMWGEHDNFYPLEKVHQIKKKLGEKARVEVLKNTSHVPQVEDPHRFNQVVLNFLLGCPRSSM